MACCIAIYGHWGVACDLISIFGEVGASLFSVMPIYGLKGVWLQ